MKIIKILIYLIIILITLYNKNPFKQIEVQKYIIIKMEFYELD